MSNIVRSDTERILDGVNAIKEKLGGSVTLNNIVRPVKDQIADVLFEIADLEEGGGASEASDFTFTFNAGTGTLSETFEVIDAAHKAGRRLIAKVTGGSQLNSDVVTLTEYNVTSGAGGADVFIFTGIDYVFDSTSETAFFNKDSDFPLTSTVAEYDYYKLVVRGTAGGKFACAVVTV